MIYRFGILLSRPDALEHLSLNKRRITGVVAYIYIYPSPLYILFFHGVKYVCNTSVSLFLKTLDSIERVRLEPRESVRGSLNLPHRSI